MLLDQELLEHWMSGDAIAGVEFGLSQPVVIQSGPGASHVGTIVALVSLDPEPVYTVEVGPGHRDVHLPQSALAAA
jgi:hypothetical protein